MIRMGIIGTNWITDQFIQAAYATKKYELTAVYSRKEATARAFGEKYGSEITYATDLAAFFSLQNLDVVYIASPNSLHYEQAKQALLAGKNVIVEKPAFSTIEEMTEIFALAKSKELFFFEAARNLHEKSVANVKAVLPAKILGANFTYMKYSSRYANVLAGEEPNIFSLKFSGGSVMDLGIYLIYAAVAWFGKPEKAYYFTRKIRTGVDGLGTIILRYKDFDVTLQTGKIANSFLPSEIYGETETILLDSVNSISSIKIYQQETQDIKEIPCQQLENPMVEEAEDFAAVLNHPTDSDQLQHYEDWLQVTQTVHTIIAELRKDAGIVFAADHK